MLFETKDEAIRFIHYNADTVEQETGKRPVRAYYCYDCGGWHVTSSRYSQNRKSILRRFGMEDGAVIFAKVVELSGKCRNVEDALLRKIRELRHLLKFEHIDVARCQKKIQCLMDDFDLVMRYQFGEKNGVQNLFNKFKGLCTLFLQKTGAQLHPA